MQQNEFNYLVSHGVDNMRSSSVHNSYDWISDRLRDFTMEFISTKSTKRKVGILFYSKNPLNEEM